MVEIVDMDMREIIFLLQEVDYAHLACTRFNHPYLIPIHYVYREPFIYIFTTEGKKTDILAGNPEVCIQVEKVMSPSRWRSVILTGKAERINEAVGRDEAMGIIREHNPSLTPAKSRNWKDTWGFQHVEVIYRIQPDSITGRKTL
jgi:nitroimidazol reductase NimA-like FMN-containing flavoprotein (pyridoxamine 5'-phosphate oxidase superfamily)